MSGSALVPPSSRRRARHGRGRPEVSREILELLGVTTDGVLAIDARCRIISWNRSAERLLGYTAEDVRGRACYDIMKGRDVHGNIFCQAHCPVVLMARRRELPYPYDVVVQTKEGHERWVNVSTLVLPGRGGEPVVVHMFRDAVVLRRWPPGDLGREPRAAPGDRAAARAEPRHGAEPHPEHSDETRGPQPPPGCGPGAAAPLGRPFPVSPGPSLRPVPARGGSSSDSPPLPPGPDQVSGGGGGGGDGRPRRRPRIRRGPPARTSPARGPGGERTTPRPGSGRGEARTGAGQTAPRCPTGVPGGRTSSRGRRPAGTARAVW